MCSRRDEASGTKKASAYAARSARGPPSTLWVHRPDVPCSPNVGIAETGIFLGETADEPRTMGKYADFLSLKERRTGADKMPSAVSVRGLPAE